MNKLLLLFFILSFSFSQNSFNDAGEREGVWRGYHANGKIKYKGQFINGKELGVFNYYDYSGNIVIELNYVDTGVTSKATLYYKNKSTKSTGKYLNKKKNSLWVYYNRYGKKTSEENYLNGHLNGDCIYYYDNGLVAERYTYLNGVKEGEGQIFYQSGFLNMQCNYAKGQLDGDSKFYYDDKKNQLESKGNYIMGLKDSTWVFYDELGDIFRVIKYKKGNVILEKNLE